MIRRTFLGLIAWLVCTASHAQVWGVNNSRTETRNDAGLQGNAGAMSGFYDTEFPVNYPAGATSWWHLLDIRHNNPVNEYTMQLAGSFFDQNLFFRKTHNNPNTAWLQVMTFNPADGTLTSGRINAATSAGQSFYIGHQVGTTYAYPSGIFRAITDNPDGATNIYYDGVTSGTRHFYVKADGQGYFANSVIIGATDTHGYKLAVGGSIIAESVTLKTQSDWPDYVFSSRYHLPSLRSVEAYVLQWHHLPQMPSASAIVKDGINLGEILKVQTQKIEELTLYMIKQQKEIESLKRNVKLSQRRKLLSRKK